MHHARALVLVLGILIPTAAAPAFARAGSGLADIDTVREEARSDPTTAETAAARRAALFGWWRLLWQQGFALEPFDTAADVLLNGDLQSPAVHRSIDAGFGILETIQASGRRVEERTGEPGRETTRTDWPGYHGPDGAQTGYSPDAGPSEGRLAWRFPKGYLWYARPVLQDGRVYAAAPGSDVIGYCLDQGTGEVVWRAREYRVEAYSTPGSVVDPIVSTGRVILATGWTAAENLFVVDRATGSILDRLPAGSRPGGAGEHLAVYKHVWRNVVLADAHTGHTVWRFPAGEFVAGEPVLAGDRVYFNRADGTLFCLGVKEGQPLWKATFENTKLRGSPGVGDQTIYTGDAKGRLHALDAASGRVRWMFRPDEQEDRAYQFFSTATEAGGRVYVGAASGYLYCLDASEGGLLWKERLSDWVRSKPLVMGKTVYAATLDSRLFALEDLGDRARLRWKRTLGEHGFTADLVGNEKVIVASGRDLVLYAVDPDTGERSWRHSLLDGIWVDGQLCVAGLYAGKYQSSPAVVDGTVYLGGPDGFLNAIDAETGEERWRFEARGGIDAAPRVAEGKVFVGQNSWQMEYYAVDQQTGRPVWTLEKLDWVGCGATGYARVYELDDDPTNDRGRLFVGTISGKLFALDPSTGAIAWQFDAGQNKGFYPHPATDATRVYTGSHDGRYYAFNQETGAVEWSAKAGTGSGGDPDSAGTTLWKDHLYVQKRGTAIAALDTASGEEVWVWKAPPGFLQNGAVAAFEDMVFGSVVRLTSLPYHTTVYAFDDVARGGAIRWSRRGGGGLTAPVGAPGKLIFGSSGEVFLTCLDPKDGSLRWRFKTGGPMEESTPAIYGDKVFALCRNGYLFAVK